MQVAGLGERYKLRQRGLDHTLEVVISSYICHVCWGVNNVMLKHCIFMYTLAAGMAILRVLSVFSSTPLQSYDGDKHDVVVSAV